MIPASNYWEEDFLGDQRTEYRTGAGELIGEVWKRGASWEVNRIRRGKVETIGTRLDKVTAQRCLINFIDAESNA
jgi:hypothetical protein